ncbi:AraC family transcriptional regulator [Acidimangrovimonas sediminis]|uniref:AraC family transcriptional regulator n=1 Tax=Acidimangrovimonas sediminis TaxID=2056283 RepID=UPI000C802617|nr:AraC family transcriptional regulator [Acidimangrovimonas sediminis]
MMPIPRLAATGRWRVESLRSVQEPMLLWFTRGQGRITVAGVTRGYGPHNAIFLPAGVMHGFEVSTHVFGTAVFFGQDCDLPLPEVPLHLRILHQQHQVELTGILDNIQRELDGKRLGYARAARHHLGLLGVWMDRQIAAADSRPAPDAATRLVTRFTSLVERDFRSGQGVAEYAAALGVTPTHLTRVCRQSCGRSAHAIVQDRLLFEARTMLLETDLAVGEVSRRLGFTSAAYFTRAFQHAIGKTPSAFRKTA